MTSVRGQGGLVQASEAPTGLSSNRSDNGDHEDYEDPLGSNKPRPSKALARRETPARPPQAPPPAPQDPGANQYSQ